MKATEVLDGQVSELEHATLEREFEADDATPFPLNSVLRRFYAAELFSDDLSHTADATELAVLFSSTFNEPIRIRYVREAQRNADERMNNGTEDVSATTVLMQELVASYGRDYAFRTSTSHRQYDAVKWYTTLGFYHGGDQVINAYNAVRDRVQPHAESAWNRVTAGVRNRIPLVSDSAEPSNTTASGTTQVFDKSDDAQPVEHASN